MPREGKGRSEVVLWKQALLPPLLLPRARPLLWLCCKLGASLIDTRLKEWPLLKRSSLPTFSRLLSLARTKGTRGDRQVGPRDGGQRAGVGRADLGGLSRSWRGRWAPLQGVDKAKQVVDKVGNGRRGCFPQGKISELRGRGGRWR